MMKRWIAASLLGLALTQTGMADVTCGLKPVKPVKPVGCKDLYAECQCDLRGQNCHWVWVCVK